MKLYVHLLQPSGAVHPEEPRRGTQVSLSLLRLAFATNVRISLPLSAPLPIHPPLYPTLLHSMSTSPRILSSSSLSLPFHKSAPSFPSNPLLKMKPCTISIPLSLLPSLLSFSFHSTHPAQTYSLRPTLITLNTKHFRKLSRIRQVGQE